MPPNLVLQRRNGVGRASHGRAPPEKFSFLALCRTTQQRAPHHLARRIAKMISVVRRTTKESKP
ncbi:hypothetical protein J2Z50_006720 [Ensifer mexicanus]|nr:hypothetical protein [Sinorhizobium mexicanum]